MSLTGIKKSPLIALPFLKVSYDNRIIIFEYIILL